MKTQSFTDLEVWKDAHEFVLFVYEYTRKFPKDELYSLVSQFRRAAISAPANIAEGYKKYGKKDKIRFYNIAQASLEECKYYLILSCDLNYGDERSKIDLVDTINRKLQNYINRIREQIEEGVK